MMYYFMVKAILIKVVKIYDLHINIAIISKYTELLTCLTNNF